jgi:hypothetical protein
MYNIFLNMTYFIQFHLFISQKGRKIIFVAREREREGGGERGRQRERLVD